MIADLARTSGEKDPARLKLLNCIRPFSPLWFPPIDSLIKPPLDRASINGRWRRSTRAVILPKIRRRQSAASMVLMSPTSYFTKEWHK